jgi:hypothetical protein
VLLFVNVPPIVVDPHTMPYRRFFPPLQIWQKKERRTDILRPAFSIIKKTVSENSHFAHPVLKYPSGSALSS